MWSRPTVSPLPSKPGNLVSSQPLSQAYPPVARPDSLLTHPATPELQDMLSFSGTPSRFSALLGRCDDGPPLVLDLANPNTGSMLILGNKHCGKTQLLRTIALSACQSNPPELVSFYIFTCQTNQWIDLIRYPHCLRIHPLNSLSTIKTISKIAEYGYHRQSARLHSPVLILFFDDLDRLLEIHNHNAFLSDLCWLVKNGPQSLIWTIASIDSAKLASLASGLANSFTTLIVGKSLPGQLDSLPPKLDGKKLITPLLAGTFVACFNQVQICFRTLLG